LYHVSAEEPAYVTAGDFDKVGNYIGIVSLFLPDQQGKRQEFPAQSRDDVVRQMPSLKKRFDTYKPYALATMNEVLTPEQRKSALRLKATELRSCYLRNEGNGRFTMIPLPNEAQVAPLAGMVADDFDGDGNLDVLINGNDYGTEVGIGRYDALNGLLLKGDGQGGFKPLSILESGIYIPGNGRALVKLRGADGGYLVAASQNKDDLKLYSLKRRVKTVSVETGDLRATIRLKNGTIRKEELYYGSSFLSQPARFITVEDDAVNVTFLNAKGGSRVVELIR
jgi:hypothetical protein